MSELLDAYKDIYIPKETPYLKDASFLKSFDKIKLKQQYVRILVLTFDEVPVQQIQGKVVGGSISLDGSSSMRRTCNINLVVDNSQGVLDNIKNLLTINKKIRVSIGFTNTTDKYTDYPILWFPQGIFVITNFSLQDYTDGPHLNISPYNLDIDKEDNEEKEVKESPLFEARNSGMESENGINNDNTDDSEQYNDSNYWKNSLLHDISEDEILKELEQNLFLFVLLIK